MKIDEFAGVCISLDLLLPGETILDANPKDRSFALEFARRGGNHVFHVQPDPAVATWYSPGMSFIRKALSTRKGFGHIAYAVENGQSRILRGRESETCVGITLEWVEALDIVALSKDLGIQEYGILRLSDNVNAILGELPGPVAKQISIVDSEWNAITSETAKWLEQWYKAATYGLWVRNDLS